MRPTRQTKIFFAIFINLAILEAIFLVFAFSDNIYHMHFLAVSLILMLILAILASLLYNTTNDPRKCLKTPLK